MPTDLTGTPTSLGIGTYNVDADAPSGLGFNEAMAQIDALIAARVAKPAGVVSGDVPVWNGTTWVRPTGTPDATKFLRGDGAWASSGSMVQLAHLVLGASQASFDTNTILGGNIPTGFSHLRLVLSLRTDQVAVQETPLIRFNNDSGALYDYVSTQSQNATETSAHAENQTSGWVGAIPAASAPAGWFGGAVVDIPAYLSTTSHKAWLATGAVLVGGAGSNLRTVAGIYHPAAVAAITRIQILPQTGPNFVSGSSFDLYGVV